MQGLAGYRDLGLAGLRPESTLAPVTDILRWASRELVTADDDAPASTLVEGRLRIDFELSRHCRVDPSTGLWEGLVMTSVSEVELENRDRGLDTLGLTHTVAGRPISLYIGAASKDEYGRIIPPALANFGFAWRGIVDGASYDGDTLRLTVQPDWKRLDQPIQQTTYGGSGGLDGTPELRNQTKPIMLGRVLAAEPVLIDPLHLIYQVNDGGMLGIDRIRDMGVPLAPTRDWDTYEQLLELVPEGTPDEPPTLLWGQYATCLAHGVFRLGAQAAGRVTLDGRGLGDYVISVVDEPFSDETLFSDGTGFQNSRRSLPYGGGVNAIAFHLLTDALGLDPVTDVDQSQILAGDDLTAGLFLPLGGKMTAKDAISWLMRSALRFIGRDRWGKWVINKIEPPAAVGIALITQENLVPDSLRRVDLPYRQPWSRWRVGWNRRWTQLNDNEIALSVGDDTRNFLKNAADYVEASDAALATLFPERKVGVLESLLSERADADQILVELFQLYTRHRQAYTLSAHGIAGTLDLGATITVQAPKLGMDDGKNLLVIGIEEVGRTRTTNLVLFG
jgi:hypothetical protein